MKRLVAIFSIVVLPLCLFVGCSAEKARGAVAYMTGELQTEVESTLDDAVGAAKGALEELQLSDIDVRKDLFKGRLEARDADRTLITIMLDRYTDNITKLGIRVGSFGDEKMSNEILKRIKQRL